jgi:hypothetical protein
MCTQAYIKAMDKKLFDDIGVGASAATVWNPVGAIGFAAGVAGTAANIISGFLGDPTEAARKEVSQRAFGYLPETSIAGCGSNRRPNCGHDRPHRRLGRFCQPH